MKKIYIVGAVSGVKNWQDKFIKAFDNYAGIGVTVRTPMAYPEGLTQKEYMKLSCESVFWADEILVTPGWKDSMGTKAEIALAKSYGCPITFISRTSITTKIIYTNENQEVIEEDDPEFD